MSEPVLQETSSVESLPGSTKGSSSLGALGSTRFDRLRGLLKNFAITLVLLAAVSWLYYKFALAPTPVLTHKVGSGELVSEVMGTGTLEARVKAAISTKIAGVITEVLVDQGDHVYAGQVLIRLDDRDLKRQVEVEQANVAAAKAALDRLVADKAYSQATLDLATSNHDRASRLIGTGAVTQEEFDGVLAALTTARAGLARAEAALVEGQKQIVAAEKTLEYHQARLEDTVINAPFDGLIVRRDRDAGETIVPGSSVLLLISLEEVWIRAWVDETRMASLQAGQPAHVIFRSEPEQHYQGTVVRLGRESDRETREFLVDILPNKLPTNWAVGQRVDVYIETARKSDAVLLPTSFLVLKDGTPGAFRVDQGKAKWRKLEIELRGRETVEIAGGLSLGDEVAVPRDPKAASLTEGRRVAMP